MGEMGPLAVAMRNMCHTAVRTVATAATVGVSLRGVTGTLVLY